MGGFSPSHPLNLSNDARRHSASGVQHVMRPARCVILSEPESLDPVGQKYAGLHLSDPSGHVVGTNNAVSSSGLFRDGRSRSGRSKLADEPPAQIAIPSKMAGKSKICASLIMSYGADCYLVDPAVPATLRFEPVRISAVHQSVRKGPAVIHCATCELFDLRFCIFGRLSRWQVFSFAQ